MNLAVDYSDSASCGPSNSSVLFYHRWQSFGKSLLWSLEHVRKGEELNYSTKCHVERFGLMLEYFKEVPFYENNNLWSSMFKSSERLKVPSLRDFNKKVHQYCREKSNEEKMSLIKDCKSVVSKVLKGENSLLELEEVDTFKDFAETLCTPYTESLMEKFSRKRFYRDLTRKDE